MKEIFRYFIYLFCFVWHNKVKSYLYYYYNFQLCDLESWSRHQKSARCVVPNLKLLLVLSLFTLTFSLKLRNKLEC